MLLSLPVLRSVATDWRWLARDDANVAPRAVAAEILRRGSDGADLYVAAEQPLIYVLTGTRPPPYLYWRYELYQSNDPAAADAPLAEALARRPRYLVTAPGPLHAAVEAALARYAPILQTPGGTRLWLRLAPISSWRDRTAAARRETA